ncbi:Uncharacterised protein [Haemophilus parainfluenzae]|nr:Uncharacterised protein [Haemophilus parainfluenzae]
MDIKKNNWNYYIHTYSVYDGLFNSSKYYRKEKK